MEDDQRVCFSCGRVQEPRDKSNDKIEEDKGFFSLFNKEKRNDYLANDSHNEEPLADSLDYVVDNSVDSSEYDESEDEIDNDEEIDSLNLYKDSGDSYISDDVDEDYDDESYEDYDDLDEGYDEADLAEGEAYESTMSLDELAELVKDEVEDGSYELLSDEDSFTKPKEEKEDKSYSKSTIFAVAVGLFLPVLGLVLGVAGIINAKKGKEGYLLPILALLASIVGFIISFLW